MALGRLCINPKDKNDVLDKDSPILRQIGWFNGHAIETAESKGIDHDNISRDKIDRLQILADMYELSSFKKMVSVLKPDIVIYFYRDSENRYSRFFDHDEIEFVRNWEFYDDKSAVREYQLGKTIILNMRHTNWMTHGNMKENECAESIYQVLSQIFFNKNLPPFISEKNHNYSVDNISIRTWLSFVEIIRTEAESKIQNMKNSSQDYQDNQTLARHLIAFLARELYKTQSTMTAQCLILLLNEVIHFRLTGWQYSPERRGPCSVVRTAWNYFDKRGRSLDAKYIADAYTKINGDYAYI